MRTVGAVASFFFSALLSVSPHDENFDMLNSKIDTVKELLEKEMKILSFRLEQEKQERLDRELKSEKNASCVQVGVGKVRGEAQSTLLDIISGFNHTMNSHKRILVVLSSALAKTKRFLKEQNETSKRLLSDITQFTEILMEVQRNLDNTMNDIQRIDLSVNETNVKHNVHKENMSQLMDTLNRMDQVIRGLHTRVADVDGRVSESARNIKNFVQKYESLSSKLDLAMEGIGNISTDRTECQTSSKCLPGWTRQNGNCLVLVKQERRWEDAMVFCQIMQSSLMYIESPEEIDYITELARANYKPIWLGGTDLFEEGSWTWVATGQPFTLTNWYPGQPQSTEYLAGADATGMWHDWGDVNTFWFVCKRKEIHYNCGHSG